MPVHLTGRIGEFDKIKSISKSFNIPIIEDAAQSIGSTYNGVKSGFWEMLLVSPLIHLKI